MRAEFISLVTLRRWDRPSIFIAGVSVFRGHRSPCRCLRGGQDTEFIESAKRKIPIAILWGRRQFLSLAVVRATRDALNAKGSCRAHGNKDHTHGIR